MTQSYNPLDEKTLKSIKVGDVVERMLAFSVPMYLKVTNVTENLIEAGWWEFDPKTGLEIDEDISMKVSYIRRIMNDEQIKMLEEGAKTIPYEG